MRRLSVANLALLLAVAALAAVVYFKPSRQESATQSLSARLPAQAAAIRIEREGSPTIVIEKTGEVWRLAAPVHAEADAFQIQRLLAILTARPVQRFPAAGLDRFELDRPLGRLAIDDEVFAFGLVNAVSNEQYVLTRDAVYAIEPRYGSALPADVMELVRKQLLSSTEVPLRFEMGTFTVEHNEGKWLLSPSTGTLSQDDLARWVENWRLASALRLAPLASQPAPATVKIDLKSGGSVNLGVVQRAPELVIARDDEGLQYHFPAAMAQRLLLPPAATREERTDNK